METPIFDGDALDGPTDSSVSMRDVDGSLTGMAGSTVMPVDYEAHADSQCHVETEWNMKVCQEYLAKVIAIF